MVRPTLDLDRHEASIRDWIGAGGMTLAGVIDTLFSDFGVKVTRRTLERRLALWNINTRPRLQLDLNGELYARVIVLFY